MNSAKNQASLRTWQNYKKFPVERSAVDKQYNGNTAIFSLDHRGKHRILHGEFIIHKDNANAFVVIRFRGKEELEPMDFYLDQRHVNSIEPLPDVGSKRIFLVSLPLLDQRRTRISAIRANP